LHPFIFCPSFQKLIPMSQQDRHVALRDPELRQKLIAENPVFAERFIGDDNLLSKREIMEGSASNYENIFCMEGERDVDYEPSPEESVAAIAKREGRNPREVAYDLMMAKDGHGTLYYPIVNYAYKNYNHVLEMFESPAVVASLSDGGAHVGLICDGSQPTFMLTHWARDRTRGDRITLERAVQLQTSATASIYGFTDRGTIEVGKRADLNIIDFDKLSVGQPKMHFDLPTNAKRYLQAPQGYVATIVAGTIIREHDRDTGARPGRLIRGCKQREPA
jgi:N-acyl-D-aspartate/D-glutamate deacylase